MKQLLLRAKIFFLTAEVTPRSWRLSLGLAGLCFLLVVAFIWPAIVSETYMPLRKHGASTIEKAVGGVLCDNLHANLSPTIQGKMLDVKDYRKQIVQGAYLSFYIQNNPEMRYVPLKDAAAAYYEGDIEKYCKDLTIFYQLHDVGLLALVYGYLNIYPEMSAHQLELALFFTRGMLVFLGVLLLLRQGVPVGMAVLMAWLCLLVDKLHQTVYGTTFYSFIVPLIFFATAFFMHVRQSGGLSRYAPALGYAVLSGVLLVFSAKLRVTLMLLIPLLLVLTLGLSWRIFPGKTALRKVCFLCVFFAITAVTIKCLNIVVFDRFIVPQDKVTKERSLEYHTMAHPILLGLADTKNPPDFVKKEKIVKNDMAIHDFVRNTGAPALSPEAEKLLWSRYIGFIKQYPLPLLSYYLSKVNEKATFSLYSATFLVRHARGEVVATKVYRDASKPYFPWPLVVALYLFWAAVCRFLFNKIHKPSAIFLTLTLAAAALLHAEMVITYSLITVHQYMGLSWLVMICCLLPFSTKTIKYFSEIWKERHASRKTSVPS